MSHPALTPDSVAVVTGGAAGIGLAAATRFAGLGLRVCIADLGADRLASCGGGDFRSRAGRHGKRHDHGMRCQPRRRRPPAGGRRPRPVRRHRRADEQCRHTAGQHHVRPGGELDPRAWRQSVGRDPWLPGLRARHDRARTAGPRHQHRLQAGHYHAAGRSGLQRRQGGREGVYRSAAARVAQHRRRAASAPIC